MVNLKDVWNSLFSSFTKSDSPGAGAGVLAPPNYTPHPGLSPWDLARAGNQQLALNDAYWLRREVSIFGDIVLTLKQELFRNGMDFEPKFAGKCATCGHEHAELVDKCEVCASNILNKPDPSQLLLFNHGDGTRFIDKCNLIGQSLQDVLEEVEEHLEIADRGILLLRKYYGMDDEGNVTESIPIEILALDPRYFKLDFDVRTGLPGGKGKVCLHHRDKLQGIDRDECDECGKKLHMVIARSIYASHTEFYIEGEIYWKSKYSSKFGHPPIFDIIDDALAYHYLEKRIRNYYEKGRPPAIIEIPSLNPESVSAQMRKMLAELAQNPDQMPYLATDPQSKKGLTVVPLMQNQITENLDVKADIRQRIGSHFGIMPLFQGDVAGAGGLNNESRQMEVSNRAFTRGQGWYNDGAFMWLMQQFGITDWNLVLNPAEDADELAEQQILSAKLDNMKKALDMGMTVEFRNEVIKLSGDPMKVEPINPPLTLSPEANEEPLPPANDGMEPDAATVEDNPTPEQQFEKSDDFLATCPHEQFVDAITPHLFLKASRNFIVQALLRMQKMTSFEKLAPQEAEGAYNSIIDVMVQEKGWSLDQIITRLRYQFPQLSFLDAERIARTETTAIANKARELDFQENQPMDTLYYWGGPDDDRTSDVCREIKEKMNGRGLPIEALKGLVNEVSLKYGMKPRDWTPHPNCRHTLRVWYGDL